MKSLKLFVIKKFVMAESAADALKKEPKVKPDSVWVDDGWSNGGRKTLADAVGYKTKKEAA